MRYNLSSINLNRLEVFLIVLSFGTICGICDAYTTHKGADKLDTIRLKGKYYTSDDSFYGVFIDRMLDSMACNGYYLACYDVPRDTVYIQVINNTISRLGSETPSIYITDNGNIVLDLTSDRKLCNLRSSKVCNDTTIEIVSKRKQIDNPFSVVIKTQNQSLHSIYGPVYGSRYALYTTKGFEKFAWLADYTDIANTTGDSLYVLNQAVYKFNSKSVNRTTRSNPTNFSRHSNTESFTIVGNVPDTTLSLPIYQFSNLWKANLIKNVLESFSDSQPLAIEITDQDGIESLFKIAPFTLSIGDLKNIIGVIPINDNKNVVFVLKCDEELKEYGIVKTPFKFNIIEKKSPYLILQMTGSKSGYTSCEFWEDRLGRIQLNLEHKYKRITDFSQFPTFDWLVNKENKYEIYEDQTN